MTATWIDKLTGSLDDKKQYRRYRERLRALPTSYRTAAEGLDRYLTYAGGITDGGVLVKMVDDLATLFEGAAADGTSVRDVVGDDPVAFAEDFLSTYKDAQWITRERTRLAETIARAEQEQS